MGMELGLGRLLEMIREHFGHKPYMATLLLVWVALIAGALSLIGFFVAAAGGVIGKAIQWVGLSTTTISSTVLSGSVLAVVTVALALIFLRYGRRPQDTKVDKRITDLEENAPRWEKTERTLQALQTEFQLYKKAVRGDGYLQDGQRLAAIEQSLDSIAQRIGKEPSFDPAVTKGQIVITYKSASFLLAMIDRTMTLSFNVRNTSSVWIAPTFQTDGQFFFEGTRMLSTRWTVWWPSATEIEPGGTKRLDLIFHISYRFAESIAFYATPDTGSFQVDLSELRVEFQARDQEGVSASVGYLPVGEKLAVPVHDGSATEKIRDYVKWRREQFG